MNEYPTRGFARRTSEVYGWSYAGLVHLMGGLHRHIGASVGSHLPMMQHSMLKVGPRLGISALRQTAAAWPWAPVEQASHEHAWCVTLALATIGGMLDRPYDRPILACEGLDQSPPSCHAIAPSIWWLWWPADAVSIWAVGGGL